MLYFSVVKELNILSAIDGLKVSHNETQNSVKILNSNVSQYLQNSRLSLEATFEAIEAVKKTSDRVDQLEMQINLSERQDKRRR
jgi:hypothetical protein